MANNTQTIRIESILGGQSPTSHFAGADQFQASVGIDPSLPATNSSVSPRSSGLLCPAPVEKASGSVLQNIPLWIVGQPKKAGFAYVYDAAGSAYSYDASSPPGTFTALSDGGSLSNSSGNGARYYDNYLYFAKNTTIARYGPLNGTPAFDGDYWVTTLGKAALSNTTYPLQNQVLGPNFPNHFEHRHSDGRMYFADVVDNQGVLHHISTRKTTVEGDTDNGSTYNALSFGYGLYPTAIESYGTSLAVALYEDAASPVVPTMQTGKAKIAFWDTVSQKANTVLFEEFGDNFITALKNVNGVLYIISTTAFRYAQPGFRVWRYLGGSSVEEVSFIENGFAPYPGGVVASGNWFAFGSNTYEPAGQYTPCVFSIGLQKTSLSSNGIFNILRTSSNSGGQVCSLLLNSGHTDIANYPTSTPFPGGLRSLVAGWGNGSNPANSGVDVQRGTYGAETAWWSQIYKIGQSFKITKIRIPLVTPPPATGVMTLVPKIYTDDGSGTTYTLPTISYTNYANKRNIVIRPEALSAEHNFWVELKWSTSAGPYPIVVSLPITIEYELVDD